MLLYKHKGDISTSYICKKIYSVTACLQKYECICTSSIIKHVCQFLCGNRCNKQ